MPFLSGVISKIKSILDIDYGNLIAMELKSDGLKYRLILTFRVDYYPFHDERKYAEYDDGVKAVKEYESLYKKWQQVRCKKEIQSKKAELENLQIKCKKLGG